MMTLEEYLAIANEEPAAAEHFRAIARTLGEDSPEFAAARVRLYRARRARVEASAAFDAAEKCRRFQRRARWHFTRSVAA